MTKQSFYLLLTLPVLFFACNNKDSSDATNKSKPVMQTLVHDGGMFSYALACYKSDLIAAVGSVSGTMLDMDCTPSHPMPVIVIHGTSDGVLPYNGSSEYNSIEAILDYWNDFNHTGTAPILDSVNDNGTTIEHYQYSQGNNMVSVEHYKIIGGDHDWFDLNYQGSNTGELIWNFVSRYTINYE